MPASGHHGDADRRRRGGAADRGGATVVRALSPESHAAARVEPFARLRRPNATPPRTATPAAAAAAKEPRLAGVVRFTFATALRRPVGSGWRRWSQPPARPYRCGTERRPRPRWRA